MRTRRAVLVLASLALITVPARARAQASDTTRIPLDPQVVTGTLPNGIRYYVRENHRPEKRAELRLAVNAGSVLEDSDQLGLAHFTEHMAFNGTRHFQKNELVEYMRSIGMRYGAELNAYTSFDETVYMLTVPTDTGNYLARGLDVLRDWADSQLFDSTEVRKERGVILEEWRLGRGANMRMMNKQLPIFFGGSRYGERLPIGTDTSIKGFQPAALVRFYHDWYRPDLQAVIAVGDFKAGDVVAMISQRFGSIPAPAGPRLRGTFAVPGADSIRYAIASDKEATGNELAVLWRVPLDSVRTEADYRRNLVESLYTGMLTMRLSELAQKPDPPFVGAGAGAFQMVRGDKAFMMSAAVKNGGEQRGLDALLTESERARRHGFTDAELERQKARILRGLEQAYAERERTESARYAGQLVSTYLRGDPTPAIAGSLEMTRRFLPGITLAEVNALSPRLVGGADRVVLISAPDKPDVHVPTPAELAGVFAAVKVRDIGAWKDELASAPLVENLPKAASVVAERKYPELGTSELKLGNGVRILMKPTDFKADEILFQAYSLGGTSRGSVRDARTLVLPLATSGGLGRFSQIDLQKITAGKVARATPILSETTQGLSGSASPRDLELALQLAYLTLTSPRVDSGAFSSMKSRMRASYENRGAMPEQAFMDTLGVTLSQHSPRRGPVTAATVDSTSYADALRIYRDRFADAGALTFVFVGAFNPDSARPLLVKYLGALPSLKRNERPTDVVPETPAGVEKKVVRKGIEQKSQVAIVYSGALEFTPENITRLQQLGSLLSNRLIDVVREELGGTYGIGAYASYNRLPRPRYQFTINFGCAPDRVDELTTRIFKEIDKLKTSGPDTAQVRKEREQARRSREVALKENRWWLNNLYANTVYEWPLSEILRGDARIESMSALTFQETARRYLNGQRYVQVVLMPAGVSAAP